MSNVITRFPSIKTPLIDVTRSLNVPFKVLFKQENCQPSGSFKLRGIGHLIGQSVEAIDALGKSKTHVFSSSGGNAGLAAAYSSRFYNVPCTVVLPKTAKASVVEDLKLYGADVHLMGDHWGEADNYLRNEVIKKLDPNVGAIYCHPFDDAIIWQGHSLLVDEIEHQLDIDQLSKVKGIVCSVGGGGLFNGIVQGLKSSKHLKHVPVLAVESQGAACFDEAIKHNKVVVLDSVQTYATSLASPYISAKSLQYYREHPVYTCKVKELDTVRGTVFYYDKFDGVVEPACGASVSIVDNNTQELGVFDLTNEADIVIVIICGGTVTKQSDLPHYKQLLTV